MSLRPYTRSNSGARRRASLISKSAFALLMTKISQLPSLS